MDNTPGIITEHPVLEEKQSNEYIPDVELEKLNHEPSVEIPHDPIAKKQYYIIGGCFRLEENALNFISDLKKQGIEAEVIGQNPGGLFMVSVFSSGSFPQVTDALTEIKASVINTAWVYKK